MCIQSEMDSNLQLGYEARRQTFSEMLMWQGYRSREDGRGCITVAWEKRLSQEIFPNPMRHK